MPFELRMYFRTLYQVFFVLKAPWTPTRIGLTFFFFVIFPFLQILNGLAFYLDYLFFPGFTKVEVKNPVFVIGNPRSGTTYFHRLMDLDREHFNAPKLWELVLVPIGFRKIIGLCAAFDRKVLNGRIAKWIEDRQAAMLKGADKVHRLRLTQAEEDEGWFIHLWASGFLTIIFPVPCLMDLVEFDHLPDERRQRLMKFYKRCIQRQLYCHGGNAVQFLSKNPQFCYKVNALYETFPDARVVYLVRTPYETVASVHNMVDKLWNIQLKLPLDAEPRKALTRTCLDWYTYSLGELDKRESHQFAVVLYKDLVNDPKGTVEAVYKKLGFPISEAFNEALLKAANKNKGYKSEHVYSLEQAGLTRDQVTEEFRIVIDRFGFLDDTSHGGAARVA